MTDSKTTRAPCPGTVVVTVTVGPFGVAAAVASAGTSYSVAVADPVAASNLVSETERRLGPVDILVNNASIIQVAPIEALGVKDFQRALAVNFWGTVHPTLAALPGMRARRRGRVVNIASIGGKVSVPHLLPYGAAKFAVVGFSEGLAAELKRDGVHVTTVVPGLMRTGSYLHAEFEGQPPAEFTWFALGSTLPGISMDAERAARRVVRALKRRELEPILLHVGHVDAARAAVAAHDRLPATDRSRAEDDDGIAEPHVEHLDAVQRARERVRDGREVGGKVLRERDQVLHGDRWDRGQLRVGAEERVIAVQQVVLAQVLEPLDAPSALAAGEDRSEEHAVAALHVRREIGVGTHLLQHTDWLVPEHPGRGRPGIPVEERSRVGPADAACLHSEDRAGGRELRLLGVADLHRVHVGHERRSHRVPPSSSLRASYALSALQRSRITRERARVIASGESCMKMFRPTEHPIAPA